MLGALLALGLPAFAQSVKVGQVGPFSIDKVSEKGKFDRCAATLNPGPTMLRISWNVKHVYGISVPAVPRGKGPLQITLEMGPLGTHSMMANGNKERTWAVLDNETVEQLMKVKKQLVVDLGTARFNYPLGTVSMGDVFQKMEDCVWKAHGR